MFFEAYSVHFHLHLLALQPHLYHFEAFEYFSLLTQLYFELGDHNEIKLSLDKEVTF